MKELVNKLNSIKHFKNATASFNESKNIIDVYIRILGDETQTKDILSNTDLLDFQYNDFGIFEFWFNPDNTDKVLSFLRKNFN